MGPSTQCAMYACCLLVALTTPCCGKDEVEQSLTGTGEYTVHDPALSGTEYPNPEAHLNAIRGSVDVELFSVPRSVQRATVQQAIDQIQAKSCMLQDVSHKPLGTASTSWGHYTILLHSVLLLLAAASVLTTLL